MKVQTVHLPDRNTTTWIVLDDNYHPVRPITAFLRYLHNLERSPNTVRSYAYHLRLYWEYLSELNIDWTAIKQSQIANFITWLRNPLKQVASTEVQEAKRTESTVNAVLTSVCMFYDFHQQEGNIKDLNLYQWGLQPGRRYKSFLHHINKGKPKREQRFKLKVPKRYPKTLKPEQVTQLIDACHRIRDKFLICLLYESGMRIGQALGLRHQDIRSWDNCIEIVPRSGNPNGARAKTREAYTVQVSGELMALYSDYLFEEVKDLDSEYVFVNLWEGQVGAAMCYGAVADLFARLSKKVGFEVHPHMLRHTHASELIRAKWPMAYVQRRLGHASIQTTNDIYVHLTDEDMKQEITAYLENRRNRPDATPTE